MSYQEDRGLPGGASCAPARQALVVRVKARPAFYCVRFAERNQACSPLPPEVIAQAAGQGGQLSLLLVGKQTDDMTDEAGRGQLVSSTLQWATLQACW
jgi:hypothetical protein